MNKGTNQSECEDEASALLNSEEEEIISIFFRRKELSKVIQTAEEYHKYIEEIQKMKFLTTHRIQRTRKQIKELAYKMFSRPIDVEQLLNLYGFTLTLSECIELRSRNKQC